MCQELNHVKELYNDLNYFVVEGGVIIWYSTTYIFSPNFRFFLAHYFIILLETSTLEKFEND